MLAEYVRGGLILDAWPLGKVADGLALLDSFITPAEGKARGSWSTPMQGPDPGAAVLPTGQAGGQWLSLPADPQHPHEDLVHALRGGLRARYPEGRTPQSNLNRVPARQVF